MRDLRRDYVLIERQSPQNSRSDGRALNKGGMRGVTSRNIMDTGFKKVAQLGVAIRGARMANEAVGSYTNNRVRQKRTQGYDDDGYVYAVGVRVAGPLGIAYAASDMAYRSLMHNIEIGKQNDEARMRRNLMGISVRNHSRSGGERI
jgi:hypothetical protein